MALLTTSEAFLDCIRKSGLVPADELDSMVHSWQEQGKLEQGSAKLARRLIRDGVLTLYQTEQLLQGKWKRFTIADKYRLLERLGAGGMGTVFLCEHQAMRRRVALKILPLEKSRDRSALDRFYREARAVAVLDHPNIVRAFDVDNDGDVHFLVMEYVEGQSLHALISRRGPLAVDRSAHYVAQAAAALQHAHEAGLVHRDIKPGNLLLDRSGTIKVLDMGLARFFHDSTDDLTHRQDARAVLGTADYLSPEQAIDSHSVDIRSDIYSLGITYYFLLAGQAPCGNGTVAEKLLWHQMRSPRPIRELRPDLPEELAAILAKMMARKPEDRFTTPFEVIEALEPWTRTTILPPTPEELPQLSPAIARMCESTVITRPATAPEITLARSAVAMEAPAVKSAEPPGKPESPAGPSACAPSYRRALHAYWPYLLALAVASFCFGAGVIGLLWWLLR